jgi:hypothetical protein
MLTVAAPTWNKALEVGVTGAGAGGTHSGPIGPVAPVAPVAPFAPVSPFGPAAPSLPPQPASATRQPANNVKPARAINLLKTSSRCIRIEVRSSQLFPETGKRARTNYWKRLHDPAPSRRGAAIESAEVGGAARRTCRTGDRPLLHRSNDREGSKRSARRHDERNFVSFRTLRSCGGAAKSMSDRFPR